jgi:hypothetical protein
MARGESIPGLFHVSSGERERGSEEEEEKAESVSEWKWREEA